MPITRSIQARRSIGLAVALAVGVTCPGSLGAAEAESFPVDSPRWQLGPEAKVDGYLGRRCLALEDGMAKLKDFEMADGVIDVDMAGSSARGFYNIIVSHAAQWRWRRRVSAAA